MNSSSFPTYFPIERGEYSVAPGLRPLGYDFGNPDFDHKIFHLTSNFPNYRANKIECRRERLSKYFCMSDLGHERVSLLAGFLIHQLVKEYPHFFNFDGKTLLCLHTKDQIEVDKDLNLISFHNLSAHEMTPPVLHILDALALQVEEDLSLVCRRMEGEESRDHLGLLHLCSPSHWAAEDKIGKNFFDIHVSIPGIEKINRMADRLVDTMINKGPYVRFIWSFVTDQRLNHHPVPPPNCDLETWKGRSFNQDQNIPFYFRIERQVTWGFREQDCSLFTIGVSFISGEEIKNNPHYKQQLLSALHSMTPEARVYKGVASCFDQLVNWLEN